MPHHVDGPRCVYSFICFVDPGLFPPFGCCESCGYEHMGICLLDLLVLPMASPSHDGTHPDAHAWNPGVSLHPLNPNSAVYPKCHSLSRISPGTSSHIFTASAPATTTASPVGLRLSAFLWLLNANLSTSCCSQATFLHLTLAKRVRSDKPAHLPKLIIRMSPLPAKNDHPEEAPMATMTHLNSVS